jgi:hypothetical protein
MKETLRRNGHGVIDHDGNQERYRPLVHENSL